MARRANKSRTGRVASAPIANQRYRSSMPRSRPSLSPRPRIQSGPYSFTPIHMTLPGDRRFFNPAPVFSRPAFSTFRAANRLVTPSPIRRARLMSARSNAWVTSFSDPSKVLVCVRRKVRREVIHALGLGGAAGMVPRRRNPFSGVSC